MRPFERIRALIAPIGRVGQRNKPQERKFVVNISFKGKTDKSKIISVNKPELYHKDKKK